MSGSGSTVTVVALGTINSGANNNNSGSAPSGIQAGYNPNDAGVVQRGVFGDVLVNDSGNIVAAAGDGINAYNYGTGNVAVNLGFGVSIQAMTSANSISGNGNSPFGIGAFNYGHGDIHVTTSSGDFIQSGSSGINASNQYNPTAAGFDRCPGDSLGRRIDSFRNDQQQQQRIIALGHYRRLPGRYQPYTESQTQRQRHRQQRRQYHRGRWLRNQRL